jgi:hypothetical protein
MSLFRIRPLTSLIRLLYVFVQTIGKRKSVVGSLSMEDLRSRRKAKLAELAGVGPFIEGSLGNVRVRCGNPACHCAKGMRHESRLLTRKVKGKTHAVYVPVAMADEVAGWSGEYRRLKKLMKEISELGERMVRISVRSGRKAGHAAKPSLRGGERT